MSALAPTLQGFFTDRLVRERGASPRTIASYRDTWRLLVRFVAQRSGKPPSSLEIDELDAPVIVAFLEHLEAERHNGVRTRNLRLAAIRSFFSYAALRHPEHAGTIARVLAIAPKRFDRALVTFLSEEETNAMLAAPDPSTWTGRRDRALLAIALQCGLRISELVGLTCGDVHLVAGAHVACRGKGRKERVTPLTRTTTVLLTEWLAERRGVPHDPLFPTRTGTVLSRDAVEHRLARYVEKAAHRCPSLSTKRVTAHVLRHTCAMRLLEAGVDTTVIACGWATSRSKRRPCTSTPTSASKSGHLNGRGRRRSAPVATDPPTPSSPSSRRCDYADLPSSFTDADEGVSEQVGLTRTSA